MGSEAKREKTRGSVACDLAALSEEQRERQRDLRRLLLEDVEEVVALEDGYAFRHSPDRVVLLAVAEFVAHERLCCPFFEFEITVGSSGGPVWLRMTGEGEAKQFLETEVDFGASGRAIAVNTPRGLYRSTQFGDGLRTT